MAGFNEAMGPGGQPAPQGAPPKMPERGPQIPQAGYQGGNGGAKPATPEQQAAYNKWVVAGMRALYTKEVSDSTIKTLKSAPNKVVGAASALTAVVTRLYTTQVKQGMQPAPEVVLHGSWELLDNIIMMAMAAGMGEFTEDDRQGAFYRAADQFRVNLAKSGLIDPNVIKQDVETLRGMEQRGEFASMAPGDGPPAEQPQQGEQPGV